MIGAVAAIIIVVGVVVVITTNPGCSIVGASGDATLKVLA